MFLYALDRDGMTHNSPDSNTIVKTNFLWTKTLIQAFNGVTLEHAKKVASHNLERIKYAKKIEEDNSNNTGKTFLEEKKEAIEKILFGTFDFGFNGLGHLYKDQGRYEEAEAEYKKSELEGSADATNYLGILYENMGKKKEAEETENIGGEK